MTTFMPHHMFDSPSSAQASFEAFIQSPQTASHPLLSDDFHRMDAQEYSPQLGRQVLPVKSESTRPFGQSSFVEDYKSSVSSLSTASSLNADSPRGSACSKSSVSPDLSVRDQTRFAALSSPQAPLNSQNGKFLDLDVDSSDAAHQRASTGLFGPAGLQTPNVWDASFAASESNTPSAAMLAGGAMMPSHHLVLEAQQMVSSSGQQGSHSRTSSASSGLGVKLERDQQASGSWLQLSSELNMGASDASVRQPQPIVLGSSNHAVGVQHLGFNMTGDLRPSPASAPSTFEVHHRLSQQHLGIPAASVLGHSTGSVMSQGAHTWTGSMLLPTASQSLAHDQQLSYDHASNSALLTSTYVPPATPIPSVLTQGNLAGAHPSVLPSSAPAQLSGFASVPSMPSSAQAVPSRNGTLPMDSSSKPDKSTKRKRKADDGDADQDAGGNGAGPSGSSKGARDRKALPKRPPPSAFQKTEAGLPFPVVDTSVKHSTLFVPPDTTGLTKREARLVKNRAAAFLSRQRKREQFDELEVRCQALSRLVWRMYESMTGSSEVEWDEAALQMGLALPSSSSAPQVSSQNGHAQPLVAVQQALGLKLREESRTVLAAFEMVVGRKGASIGPLEGELPLEQGPPLGAADMYVPSHPTSEPRLAMMHADLVADADFDTDNDEGASGSGGLLQARQLGSSSSTAAATPTRLTEESPTRRKRTST